MTGVRTCALPILTGNHVTDNVGSGIGIGSRGAPAGDGGMGASSAGTVGGKGGNGGFTGGSASGSIVLNQNYITGNQGHGIDLNKIGRASCRERVEISVVAVSLKKKFFFLILVGSINIITRFSVIRAHVNSFTVVIFIIGFPSNSCIIIIVTIHCVTTKLFSMHIRVSVLLLRMFQIVCTHY